LLYFIIIVYLYFIIWYMFSRFGKLQQEKSGNPVCDAAPRMQRH
jgi:hypothetical protein